VGKDGGSVVFSPSVVVTGHLVKILICSESENLRSTLRLELEAAGHQVVDGAVPGALAPAAPDAGALLVDPARAKHAIALLRDRGFAGRALVTADAPKEELARQVQELGADGALAMSPRDDLPRRFAVAVGGRRRVLIVDDSEIVARLLRLELEKAGFAVDYAPDVEKATSLILKRATRPDLVLLDINMPRVSGPQFCRFIKTNERFRSIKVIFCSGEDREKMAALATEFGADGYILKREFLGKWVAENT
jgi:CheY-like chemotaxis protein